MIVEIDSGIIPYEKRFQGLCRRPYRGHPKGCPNFGKKPVCPPKPLIDKVFDFEKSIFVIYTSFEVGEFAERMRQEHPQWADHPRQWYNPRRWQPKARKEHRKEIGRFLSVYSGFVVNTCPEAHGVNVTDLMKKIGVSLEWVWPPDHSEYSKNFTYMVSLAGSPKLQKLI